MSYFFFGSNLIQPPGMMLRPAFFSLKVFKAEDIPQSKFFSYTFLEKNLLTKADDKGFFPFFVLWQMGHVYVQEI